METAKPESICRRCLYRGRVQGVGFRYSSLSISRRYAVGGYVKNLADGSVELVVQAEPQVVQAFLDEIGREFDGKIVDCTCQDLDSGSLPKFTGFEVR